MFDFLNASQGDIVVIQNETNPSCINDWWMGRIIHVVTGAREIKPSLFQVICIDTGTIRMINADLVIGIIEQSQRTAKGR